MVDTAATTLMINARVLTMDPMRPSASAVRISGDRIVEVGGEDLAGSPGQTVIDLGGRMVLPGFIDAHNHLSISAMFPRWADLRSAGTVDQVYEILAAQAEAEPEAAWIRGAAWRGTPALNRHLLDEFGFDRPVLVANVSLHDGVIDSRGMAALGIDENTPDPPVGHYERDTGGTMTGRLFEQAFGDAHAAGLAGFDDPAAVEDAIVARARTFLPEGITAIHDAACAPESEDAYRRLARAGRLPISVLSMPHARAMFHDDPDRRIHGARTGEGDEWFRVGPVKFFADGGNMPAMSSVRDPHTAGLLNADLADLVRSAVQEGYRVAVHAVGDLALQSTLEAFAAAATLAPDDDHRFRVEHGFITHAEQIADMAALGVVASVQPGVEALMGAYLQAFGPRIHERAFRYDELARARIPMAASSDDPCTPYGPILNSIPASIRRTGIGASHAMPMEHWMHAFTAGAAYAGGQESERGSITVGRRADLVVLDGRLDADRPPVVEQTWVAGRCVWHREGGYLD